MEELKRMETGLVVW